MQIPSCALKLGHFVLKTVHAPGTLPRNSKLEKSVDDCKDLDAHMNDAICIKMMRVKIFFKD